MSSYLDVRDKEYSLALSHLSRTVGWDLVQDLAKNMGNFTKIIDNVRRQRDAGVAPEVMLDLDALGLNEEQKERALVHQEERAALVNEVAERLSVPQHPISGFDDEGYGVRPSTIRDIKPREPIKSLGESRVNKTGDGAERV